MEPIYLDNAASTRTDDAVLSVMTEVMRTAWGNPSSPHPQGAAARSWLDRARSQLLGALTAGDSDVIWTSGCSEANALAVLGAAHARRGAIVLTTVEHPAVGTLASALTREGREVRMVAPGRGGVIDPDGAAAAVTDDGVLAVVMVQNEIGVVQPIAAIVEAVRRRAPGCHIHVDAAQAIGKVACDASALGVDSIAIAGHKLHAPKGCGALWLRTTARVEPLWVGGGQQRGLRGGTLDAAGAAALALAVERAVAAAPAARVRWLEYAHAILKCLADRGARVDQLVPDHRRAPHILALAVPGVPAAALRTVLASRGVYISTGSACAASTDKPSPILEAVAMSPDAGMVRISFGLDTTAADVDRAAPIIADVIVEQQRAKA